MSLQDIRASSGRSVNTGLRLVQPQTRETRKARRPEALPIQMPDGRLASYAHFRHLGAKKSELADHANGCAETVRCAINGGEWKKVFDWMKSQRARVELRPFRNDTFVAILIAHAAEYRKKTLREILHKIQSDGTADILFTTAR